MATYYDIIKLIFFFLTMLVGLYQLRIKWVLSPSVVDVVGPFVMPFYLVVVWLIIGYIIGYVLTQKRWKMYEDKSYMQGFIIWGIIWVILSAVYYFILS